MTWRIRPSVHAFDLPPGDLLALARAVDALGFDAFWLGEHIVAPTSMASVHPGRSSQPAPHSPVLAPGAHLADLWVQVGAVAAVTEHVQISTGMCIAPLRHPLVIAQSAATASRVSNGRFSLGVGVGWLAEEFAALDVDFAARGAILDETIEILRRAWRGGPFCFDGQHFRFDELTVSEDALDIGLVLGGNSAPALRRLAIGDGWFSSGTPTFAQARELRAQIQRVRPDLRCWFRVEAIDAATVSRYVDHGFDDLVFHIDQHVATRVGGWRAWLDAVLHALEPHAAAVTRSAGC